MTSVKKTLPRGYNEIASFIDAISNKSYFNEMPAKNLEQSIDEFLEECYRRRLSVTRCLLDIFREYQNNDAKGSVVALILSRCEVGKTLSSVIEFIKNEEDMDKLKRKLLLVLEKYESTDDVAQLVEYFEDKEWLAEYALNSLLDNVGKGGENIGTLFQHLEGQEPEFYQALIATLAHRIDEESIWLLGVLAEFPDEKIAEAAIQTLGYRKSSLAYEMLDNIITYRDKKKELRMQSMSKLEQLGVSRIASRTMTPHKCYLSWIDSHGSRILLVSRRTGRGRLYMVTFILNEDQGIEDCTVWHNISTFEMESLIKGLENQVGLKQIDYKLGIEMVQDSLWRIVDQEKLIPPTFLVARRIFGSQKIAPKKYQVNLTGMGVFYVQKKFDSLLANSDELLQESEFAEWWLDTPEAYDFVQSRPSLLNGRKTRKDTIKQFIKSFLEDKRDSWKNRFLMSAEFLHRTSPRTYREQIEMCLAVYLYIDQGKPLTSIPFMIKLAELSIDRMCQKIKSKDEGSGE